MLTKEDILDRILNGEFSSFIELHSETRGDIIYIPESEMKIKPYVWEVKERIVNISFDMYSDVLKTRFFEFSTGLTLFFGLARNCGVIPLQNNLSNRRRSAGKIKLRITISFVGA